ncbi:MAG: TIGR04255 family protein [Methanobrevibacter sp.]|uniref:TIGR04255 family protein n=1 Tax=Methanobrevibacter sp. TaxID=66852 RepID=UPI0025FB11E2|nr:TIGR04255 family protein [Methanobrevibacter sp.]MBQ6099326.1 TIGR04255 family protein [Methanobrevibacter sp.]
MEDNFLNEIIFRIDFTTILKICGDEKESVDDFRNAIFDDFPNVEILHQKKFNLDIDVESGYPKNLTHEGNLCWIFRNDNADKEVSLTSNNLVLNYKRGAYKGFKLFLDDVMLIISALKQYSPFKLNFLGLRYINEIYDAEINDDIHKYVSNSLSNTALLNDFKENQLIQFFSKLQMQKDDYIFTMQYGFYNPTENPDHEKHFILDYDCVNKNVMNIDDVKEHLIEMNSLIFEKFEYSITDEFIEKMGEKYDSSSS